MPNTKQKVDLSIILTGYNEGKILKANLNRIYRFLGKFRYSWEIILYDDASTDATRVVFRNFAKNHNNVRYFFHSVNIGRGGTVMDAINKSRGKMVGFIDTDFELSYIYLPDFVLALEEGFDLAVGKRIYPIGISNIIRTLASKGYILITHIVLGIKVSDTEAGFKFFIRSKINKVINKIQDKRWFFDTELIARSIIAGFKLKEIPILYIKRKDKQSSVRLMRDTYRYLINVIRFRLNQFNK